MSLNTVKALMILNANPRGCNQYKPCSGSGKSAAKGKAKVSKAEVVKAAKTKSKLPTQKEIKQLRSAFDKAGYAYEKAKKSGVSTKELLKAKTEAANKLRKAATAHIKIKSSKASVSKSAAKKKVVAKKSLSNEDVRAGNTQAKNSSYGKLASGKQRTKAQHALDNKAMKHATQIWEKVEDLVTKAAQTNHPNFHKSDAMQMKMPNPIDMRTRGAAVSSDYKKIQSIAKKIEKLFK